MLSSIRNVHNAAAAKAAVAKKFVFVKPFEGPPKLSDFRLVQEELRPVKDGEYLAEAVYLSVDPYMRTWAKGHVPGNTVFGVQIARITQSRHKDFPIGEYVAAGFGWRSHTVAHGDDKTVPFGSFVPPYILNFGQLPKSLGLGILGMPGNTAYFALKDIVRPKPGETVVVSGAAGAVGSLAGQIAKIEGARVVGVAGTDEKVKWLTQELGFDDAVNYRTSNLKEALLQAAPKGIDGYFDNVGGETSSIVLHQMNVDGRIAVVGSISFNNADPDNRPKATVIQRAMVVGLLEMKGFTSLRYANKWFEGIDQIKKWVLEGKIKYRETITEGFENAPKAFIGMLSGENIGKAVVKVADT